LLEAENAVLRHQLIVLQHQLGVANEHDRLFFRSALPPESRSGGSALPFILSFASVFARYKHTDKRAHDLNTCTSGAPKVTGHF